MALGRGPTSPGKITLPSINQPSDYTHNHAAHTHTHATHSSTHLLPQRRRSHTRGLVEGGGGGNVRSGGAHRRQARRDRLRELLVQQALGHLVAPIINIIRRRANREYAQPTWHNEFVSSEAAEGSKAYAEGSQPVPTNCKNQGERRRCCSCLQKQVYFEPSSEPVAPGAPTHKQILEHQNSLNCAETDRPARK